MKTIKVSYNGFDIEQSVDECLYDSIYNKAIDDFIHECDKHCGFYTGDNKNLTREDILHISEQLKS